MSENKSLKPKVSCSLDFLNLSCAFDLFAKLMVSGVLELLFSFLKEIQSLVLWLCKVKSDHNSHLIVYSYHVTYAFQSESTLRVYSKHFFKSVTRQESLQNFYFVQINQDFIVSMLKRKLVVFYCLFIFSRV